MGSTSYELRFVVRHADGDRRGVSWKVWTTHKGDIYVQPRGQSVFKTSLHVSGQHQTSHLDPFWNARTNEVVGLSSRHVDRWRKGVPDDRRMIVLFHLVFPGSELQALAELRGDELSATVRCPSDAHTVEVWFVSFIATRPEDVWVPEGHRGLARWPIGEDTLCITEEHHRSDARDASLLVQTPDTSTDVRTPRREPVTRMFVTLEGSDGLRGIAEISGASRGQP